MNIKMMRSLAIFAAVVMLAAGCAERDMGDLQQWTENLYKNRKPKIESLPQIRPSETFVYAATTLADPFSASNLIKQKPPAASGQAPDQTRRKEPLEQYPLDGLRMVGTLFRNESSWVILRAPDGTVHRVREGNHVGQSYGVITDISEEQISIKELVQDPNGAWVERLASLSVQ
ncbi:MAG: pilus assembly protein PilP [Gammaproteobacteria bacterium]|nr:pilus assembly protein PilP [Gammaproteobacteria bacterium]